MHLRPQSPAAAATSQLSPPTLAPTPALHPLPKVLVLTGPTAVGKSATALQLCNRLAGEIVSADSVQLYRRLDIGSNKPLSAERVATPHHLVDIVEPCHPYTAGDFFRAARAATQHILARRRVPVVVGGTMMYVRWFLHGKPATPPPDADARRRATALVDACCGDWDAAIDMLARTDPQRAQRLSRNDWYRLGRALEVVETTGVPMTQMPLVGGAPQAHGSPSSLDFDFRCVFLVDERRPMNRRIDQRCESMILPPPSVTDAAPAPSDHNILTEVCNLLVASQLRVAAASPCLAIGYRQTISYLVHRALQHSSHDTVPQSGDSEEQDADADAVDAFRSYLDEFQQATRNYAKQQIAWFRKEPMFRWVSAGPDAADAIERIYSMDREEYDQLCEDSGEQQAEMKADMIAQGKLMKTYMAEQTWLTRGSNAEATAVELGERCARKMVAAIERTELQRMLDIVKR